MRVNEGSESLGRVLAAYTRSFARITTVAALALANLTHDNVLCVPNRTGSLHSFMQAGPKAHVTLEESRSRRAPPPLIQLSAIHPSGRTTQGAGATAQGGLADEFAE
jgi:hypothetical protein